MEKFQSRIADTLSKFLAEEDKNNNRDEKIFNLEETDDDNIMLVNYEDYKFTMQKINDDVYIINILETPDKKYEISYNTEDKILNIKTTDGSYDITVDKKTITITNSDYQIIIYNYVNSLENNKNIEDDLDSFGIKITVTNKLLKMFIGNDQILKFYTVNDANTCQDDTFYLFGNLLLSDTCAQIRTDDNNFSNQSYIEYKDTNSFYANFRDVEIGDTNKKSKEPFYRFDIKNETSVLKLIYPNKLREIPNPESDDLDDKIKVFSYDKIQICGTIQRESVSDDKKYHNYYVICVEGNSKKDDDELGEDFIEEIIVTIRHFDNVDGKTKIKKYTAVKHYTGVYSFLDLADKYLEDDHFNVTSIFDLTIKILQDVDFYSNL